ncbi:hypothetical protein AOC36_02545 [Erysipelothrix larvae]|uniref:Glycosyl transferase family 1 n=1 Tax=Erysipelothrix larvae TaxID=1514105 RepID=A0A0X8GYS5_9FIRM|nr:glycosyltransferase family 1 protein [Erysipelothrix larvae]AMC92901.1 hypothetical protein AOC36_02545 [Erysipelothrix larvae]
MEQIRVLYIHGGTLARGGTESFMMNTLRTISRDIHIDFVVHGDEKGVYDDEVEALGSSLMHVPIKSKDPLGNKRMLTKIMREGNYDIVHAHLNAMNGPALKIAKACGIKVRISHSHASEHYTQNPLKTYLNNRAMKSIPKVATDLFSCSQKAGDFLYGTHPYTIWYNAVELDRFAFDRNKQEKLKAELNLSDKRVYGHIGRFNFQKNHPQLIKIFEAIHREDPKSHLVLVGTGEREMEIQQLIHSLALDDAITHLGSISNVHEILNLFDLFVLPSLFEGLPYVLVEAQANGLPIISSDNIDQETKINDNFIFIDPNDIERWVKTAQTLELKDRSIDVQRFIDRGFELKSATQKLEHYYKERVKGNTV